MSNINKLSNAIKFALFIGATASFATASAFAQDTAKDEAKDEAKEITAVTVTGSRIKRVNAEAPVPVTVITREQIERSGDISVADIMRDVTFSSAGNFRPQSGSSAQALADIDLRALGSNRTLVLIDGRRAPKAPFVGSTSDLNSIPLAAVERIEILTAGASAIYGSDAIGGVVNIITRKDFSGAELRIGTTQPSLEGGGQEEVAALMGVSSDRGSMIAGVSFTDREIIFTRDRPWGANPGASTFSNSWRGVNPATGGVSGTRRNIPGYACNDRGFYLNAGGNCVYNFNLEAADEAAIKNTSLFTRGEYEINDQWSTYMVASVSRVQSFGRYAPAPVELFVADGGPNDPNPVVDNPATLTIDEGGAFVRHRFAAGGNRDTNTDSNVYDAMVGFKGTVFETAELDAGYRRNQFQYFEIGNGLVVRPLFEAAVNSGAYNLSNPFGNSQNVINSVKVTTSRDSTWTTEEFFGTLKFDIFELSGGSSSMVVGAEYRSETYSDLYDSLSTSGVVEGSAGNSAGGGRNIRTVFAEANFPILSNLEVGLAGRYDQYSDYGNDFAPAISALWKPFETLAVRASYNEGFGAPSLDVLSQQPAFSADSVSDIPTCLAFGFTPAQCNSAAGVELQINATVIANSALTSEQSKNWNVGLVWDATDWLSMTLDYSDVTITNRIVAISSQTIINRSLNPALGPIPAGLSITRDPITGEILNITRGSANEGELTASFIDANIRTNFDFGGWGSLNNSLSISYVNDYQINGGVDLASTEGLPAYRVALANTWTKGDFSVSWNTSYIDKQDKLVGVVFPSQTLHNLQATWKTPWQGQLTFGINNIEDELPRQITSGGRPFNFNLYDAYGRVPYLRYSQSF